MPFGDRFFGARFFGNAFFGPNAGGGPVSNISLVGTPTTARTTANATSLPINVVSGVANGDLLILQVLTRVSATAGAIGGLSAWTQIQVYDAAGVSHQHRVYYRVASSEPASYTATITTSSAIAATMTAWRPASGYALSVATSSVEEDAVNNTTVSSAGITTPGDDQVVVTCFGVNDGTTPTRIPLTLNASQTKQAETNTTGSAVGMGPCQASELRATAGATGARNATTAGGNSSNSTIIAVIQAQATGVAGDGGRRRRRARAAKWWMESLGGVS